MRKKICTKCGELKLLEDFSPDTRAILGVQSQCRKCNGEYVKKWHAEHREEKRQYDRMRYLKVGHQVRLRSQIRYRLHRDEANKGRRQRYAKAKNTDINGLRIKERNRKSAQPNYRRWLYRTDVNFRLRHVLRSRFFAAIKGIGKKESVFDLVGCSVNQLAGYLESQFQLGMSWSNHGRGPGCWHIDHVKPCASFDFTSESQKRECFHYTNFQPLWEKDNLSKSSKYGFSN